MSTRSISHHIVLRWPYAVDRTLKSKVKLTLITFSTLFFYRQTQIFKTNFLTLQCFALDQFLTSNNGAECSTNYPRKHDGINAVMTAANVKLNFHTDQRTLSYSDLKAKSCRARSMLRRSNTDSSIKMDYKRLAHSGSWGTTSKYSSGVRQSRLASNRPQREHHHGNVRIRESIG